MWSARLRRYAQARRAQRRAAPKPWPRRGPVDASDWARVSIGPVALTVSAGDPGARRYWDRVASGAWEPETFAWLERELAAAGPAPLLVDIGAWVGAVTLFAAGRGAKTLAIEPDPAARGQLLDNLAANPDLAERVAVAAAAFDQGAQRLTLYPHAQRFGASKTSALPDVSGLALAAPTLSAEGVIARARRLGSRSGAVVKIDIGGHECAIGPEAARLIRGLGASALITVRPRAHFEAARRRGAPAPHLVADQALRACVAALRAEGLDVTALDRPGVDALTRARHALFRRGPAPRDLALSVAARPAAEPIRD